MAVHNCYYDCHDIKCWLSHELIKFECATCNEVAEEQHYLRYGSKLYFDFAYFVLFNDMYNVIYFDDSPWKPETYDDLELYEDCWIIMKKLPSEV